MQDGGVGKSRGMERQEKGDVREERLELVCRTARVKYLIRVVRLEDVATERDEPMSEASSVSG